MAALTQLNEFIEARDGEFRKEKRNKQIAAMSAPRRDETGSTYVSLSSCDEEEGHKTQLRTKASYSLTMEKFMANLQKYKVLLVVDHFSESSGRSRSIKKIILNLGVNDSTELFTFDLGSHGNPVEIANWIASTSGYDPSNVPLLFVDSKFVGDYNMVLKLVKSDNMRSILINAGLDTVVNTIPTATLQENIYGYPKSLGKIFEQSALWFRHVAVCLFPH